MRLLGGVLLLLALGACATKPRFEPAELKRIAQPEVKVATQWSSRVGALGDQPALRPVVAAGRVFVAAEDGVVEALDAAGQRLWRVATERRLGAGPALIDGKLIVGSRDGELLALRALDGGLEWETQLSSAVATIPGGDDGVLAVKTEDGRIHALSPRSGETRWVAPLTVPALTWRGNAPLVVTEDAVLVGTSTGRLQALARGDGSPLWEQVIAEPRGRSEIERLVDVDADLLLVGPVIIAQSTAGNLRVLRRQDGQVIWERAMGGFVAPAIDDNCLYVVDREDVVSCLDPRTGAAQWTQENLRFRRLTAPVAHKGNVLLGDLDGYLHVLSAANGSIIARTRLARSRLLWLGDGPEGSVLAAASNGTLKTLATQPLSTADRN